MQISADDLLEIAGKVAGKIIVACTALATMWKLFLRKFLVWVRDRINKVVLDKLDIIIKMHSEETQAISKRQEESAKVHIEILSKIAEIKDAQDFHFIALKASLKKSDILWWISDSEGRTIEVSTQLSTYMQLPEEAMMDTNWLNRIPRKYHKAIMEDYKSSIDTKRDFYTNYPFKKGNGEEEWFRAFAKKAGMRWFGIVTPIAGPPKGMD